MPPPSTAESTACTSPTIALERPGSDLRKPRPTSALPSIPPFQEDPQWAELNDKRISRSADLPRASHNHTKQPTTRPGLTNRDSDRDSDQGALVDGHTLCRGAGSQILKAGWSFLRQRVLPRQETSNLLARDEKEMERMAEKQPLVPKPPTRTVHMDSAGFVDVRENEEMVIDLNKAEKSTKLGEKGLIVDSHQHSKNVVEDSLLRDNRLRLHYLSLVDRLGSKEELRSSVVAGHDPCPSQAVIPVLKRDTPVSADAVNLVKDEARDLTKDDDNATNSTPHTTLQFIPENGRSNIDTAGLVTSLRQVPCSWCPDTRASTDVRPIVAASQQSSGHPVATQQSTVAHPLPIPPATRTSSRSAVKSNTSVVRQLGPTPVTYQQLDSSRAAASTAGTSKSNQTTETPAVGHFPVVQSTDGKSSHSPPQSPTIRIILDDRPSESVPVFMMSGETAQGQLSRSSSQSTFQSLASKKPSEPPNSPLPAVPESQDGAGSMPKRTRRLSRQSSRRSASQSSVSTIRPLSPQSLERSVDRVVQPGVRNLSQLPPINTALLQDVQDSASIISPRSEPRSASSAGSRRRSKVQSARAEKVRAMMFRDTAEIRARNENRILEEKESPNPHGTAVAAAETGDLSRFPSVPLHSHSSSRASTVSRDSLRRRQSWQRSHSGLVQSPIMIVAEADPTRTMSPRSRSNRSIRSHITANGTHTPPRSDSSIPSSDEEGSGVMGAMSPGAHRLRSMSPPLKGKISQSSMISITNIETRMASLEKTTENMNEMLLLLIEKLWPERVMHGGDGAHVQPSMVEKTAGSFEGLIDLGSASA